MLPSVSLRELRSFIAVADNRHFGRAAASLGVSQPAVSQAVARLEERLQLRLLHRDGGVVVLTGPGELLHRRTRHLVAALDHAIGEIQQHGAAADTSVVLGVADSLLHPLAAAAVAAVTAPTARVRVGLREVAPVAQAHDLRNGAMDAGLLYLPLEDGQGITAEELRTEGTLVALPPGHRLARRHRLRAADLDGEPAVSVSRTRHPGLYDQTAEALAAAGVEMQTVQYVEGKQALLALVAAGVGVALVPEGLQDVLSAQVVYRRLDDLEMTATVAVITRTEPPSAALQALLQALRAIAATGTPRATGSPGTPASG